MRIDTGKKPGIIVAGLRGSSGKTIISLGIIAAWKENNLKVSPFKKGPDYIDAGWLSKAAGCPCYNLDTFLCDPEAVHYSFFTHSTDCDIIVVEGNRGLYDGIDTDGSTSTAELAKLLKLPVLLVLDCTKATRTMAALLAGCIHFDLDINICGVILNQVAGTRHEKKIRDNIDRFCKIPVFGAIPKLTDKDFPERHMGLITSEEHRFSDEAIKIAHKIVTRYIDLEQIYNTVRSFACNNDKKEEKSILSPTFFSDISECSSEYKKSDVPVIGVIRDSAFQFYYPDNLDMLEKLGAIIVFISPLIQENIPDIHAIYMGGGFPENHASQLADNKGFQQNIKSLALAGLPIYAECGGLIFLGKSILIEGIEYPMSGVFPICFGLSKKPQAHGYTIAEVTCNNPFYAKGELLKGHEFRYSEILDIEYNEHEMAFRMKRGKGIIEKKDGFFRYNTFGTYTHIHALGTLSWAPSLIKKAKTYKAKISQF